MTYEELQQKIIELENKLSNQDYFTSQRGSEKVTRGTLKATRLKLLNQSANPIGGVTGELAVVGGKLKIYTGSSWTVVGTQT